MSVYNIARSLKRAIRFPLVAAVLIFTCHLAMAGEVADSLYQIFPNADKDQKVALVNQLSHLMFEREVTDTLYVCSSSTKPDEIDAMMHYLMSEYYYDR